MSPEVVFLDPIGRVLAKGLLPESALIEGEHGSRKEFEISAKVIATGKLDHYITTANDNQAIKGRVVQKPASGLGCFSLGRLDVRAGERITGRMQALTVKEVTA